MDWKRFSFYQIISRTIFKTCFSRSCLHSRVPRHVLEILLSHRHNLVVQNRWASVRLHHCSNKLLPFNIKSINPYKSIYTLLNCVLVLCKYLLLYFFSNEFSNFFWIMFNSKAIKVCCIFSIHICYSIWCSYAILLIDTYQDLWYMPHPLF